MSAYDYINSEQINEAARQERRIVLRWRWAVVGVVFLEVSACSALMFLPLGGS